MPTTNYFRVLQPTSATHLDLIAHVPFDDTDPVDTGYRARCGDVLMRGADLLREYMASFGFSQTHVASLTQTTSSVVYRWINGQHAPSAEFRRRIEDVTGGAVPSDSWDEVEEHPQSRAIDCAMSHEEIGRELGLSPERVQQIEASALRKLRRSPLLRELWQMEGGSR